ncbi:MAG: 50S ribosomal protein L18 [Candidatus Omnitrophota bacterium]|nr:50S ribosomal protein L18 [Candidatus Omnitrophota bacterium]
MKGINRQKRHQRTTKNMQGGENKPRLVIFRSKKHIYAQLVRDDIQKVVVGCSTLSKDFKSKNMKSTNKEAAKEVGKLIAEKALKLGIKEVCFDRAGYKYHGRIEALSQGAREGGLKF